MTEREELLNIIINADEEQMKIIIETFIEFFDAKEPAEHERHHHSSSLRCQ